MRTPPNGDAPSWTAHGTPMHRAFGISADPAKVSGPENRPSSRIQPKPSTLNPNPNSPSPTFPPHRRIYLKNLSCFKITMPHPSPKPTPPPPLNPPILILSPKTRNKKEKWLGHYCNPADPNRTLNLSCTPTPTPIPFLHNPNRQTAFFQMFRQPWEIGRNL